MDPQAFAGLGIALAPSHQAVRGHVDEHELDAAPIAIGRPGPVHHLVAGLAAMITYDPERAAAENESAMVTAQEGVATGEVTIASRDVTLDGIDVRKGAWLGLADGAAVASGQSFDTVAGAVAERLLDGGREILTLLTGADEPALEALVGEIEARYPEVEIEIHVGGQPHYPLLLSAE